MEGHLHIGPSDIRRGDNLIRQFQIQSILDISSNPLEDTILFGSATSAILIFLLGPARDNILADCSIEGLWALQRRRAQSAPAIASRRRRDRWAGAKGVSGLWCRKGGGLVVVVVVAAAGYRGDRRVEGVLRRVV